MILLGIHDGTHDAGAALVVDGAVRLAVNEERFSRRKGQGGWPGASVARCLAEVPPERVDRVVYAGFTNPNPVLRALRPLQRRFRLDAGWFYGDERGLGRLASDWLQFDSPFPHQRAESGLVRLGTPLLRAVLARHARGAGLRAPVTVLDHHLCHAAGAFAGAGWTDALVLVADGVGDGLALTAWKAGPGGLHRLLALPYPHSYGLLYATMTGFLGFRPFRHEGKLVGLAALGDADAVEVPWPFEGPPEARRFTQHFGARLRPWLDRFRGQRREDVAAWLQRGVERDLVALVDHLRARTGHTRLVLAGGVFANVRLNQALGARVDALAVHPHMGDGGLAVGAALALAGPTVPLDDAFLGPRYPDAELEGALDGCRVSRPQDLAGEVADRLSRGQIVARFDGRSEYGPRALGNRSILASAGDPSMTDRLNVALSRSDFMPFAPLLLEEDADDWVDGLEPLRAAARFMTVTVGAKPALRAACPAAVHVDGTLRPQLVDARRTPWLHATLRAYRARTGRPALINTSFNLHEEPIVESPADAVRTFRSARINALAIGPFLATDA